jgi:hypothetical protein
MILLGREVFPQGGLKKEGEVKTHGLSADYLEVRCARHTEQDNHILNK